MLPTICTGLAASMGAVLLCAGVKGKRTCLKHSRVMIHQPSGGMQGQFTDMEISYNLIKSMKHELYNEKSWPHTGQTAEKIEADCDRDNWMSAGRSKSLWLSRRSIDPNQINNECPKVIKQQMIHVLFVVVAARKFWHWSKEKT